MGRCEKRGAFCVPERVPRRADAARGADGRGAGSEHHGPLCLVQVCYDSRHEQSLDY